MDDERTDRGTPGEPADEQERRAHQALESIFTGGDLGEETLRLSNEFTDRQTARMTGWFRGILGSLRRR